MIRDIDEEIYDAELHLGELIHLKAMQKPYTVEQEIAILLHDSLCKRSHIIVGECNWFFEDIDGTHDWTQLVHEAYLLKTQELLAVPGCTPEILKCSITLHIPQLRRFLNIKKE
jgi:hypothetical protein